MLIIYSSTFLSQVTKGKNNLDKALKVAKKLNKEINAIQIFITTVNEELDTKNKTPAVKNSDSTLSYITVSIVKPAHAAISIQQSPVLKGHLLLVLSQKISCELNLF
jgi:hypothetical protein